MKHSDWFCMNIFRNYSNAFFIEQQYFLLHKLHLFITVTWYDRTTDIRDFGFNNRVTSLLVYQEETFSSDIMVSGDLVEVSSVDLKAVFGNGTVLKSDFVDASLYKHGREESNSNKREFHNNNTKEEKLSQEGLE